MWSVVERTALAEAEIEYADYESDTIWVKFPIASSAAAPSAAGSSRSFDASVVIWTTTPWTIPANRAISFSSKIAYGLYEVTKAPEGNWAAVGEKYVLADKLAAEVMQKAKVEAFERVFGVTPSMLAGAVTEHPLRGLGGGYEFDVPLLDGEHVTDDAGTGFVHTAPGHGLDDFGIWMDSSRKLAALGHRHRHPLRRRRRRLLHQRRAGLRRRARHRRHRQEGRRQQPRHRGARRARRDGRARPREASVSAFAGAPRSR